MPEEGRLHLHRSGRLTPLQNTKTHKSNTFQ